MLEEALVRLGKRSLACWIAAVALSMLQSVTIGDSNVNYEQQAVERVIALNYRILASQESAPWDQNIPSIITPSATGTNTTPGESGPNTAPDENLSFEWINQVDMSSWLPDNMWPLDAADMNNDLSWV